ncbi:hypothetical protein PHYPSEUDO_007047 [Phytophthora pseudosyringae]|uniref:Uncharacterized protein n=1 Tax=Phytophthora pseudosyringae TaxID=221518 RepID=A0A8T1VGW3_9STRA|nr:hypothetical protein PHYPSEUDO_007047 [Phytophthora pseudosyringae]
MQLGKVPLDKMPPGVLSCSLTPLVTDSALLDAKPLTVTLPDRLPGHPLDDNICTMVSNMLLLLALLRRRPPPCRGLGGLGTPSTTTSTLLDVVQPGVLLLLSSTVVDRLGTAGHQSALPVMLLDWLPRHPLGDNICTTRRGGVGHAAVCFDTLAGVFPLGMVLSDVLLLLTQTSVIAETLLSFLMLIGNTAGQVQLCGL